MQAKAQTDHRTDFQVSDHLSFSATISLLHSFQHHQPPASCRTRLLLSPPSSSRPQTNTEQQIIFQCCLMATQQLQPKAVLRLLLRAVDKHITSVAGNQQWRQHVLQQFRQGRDADAPAAQRLLLLAQEYANLVTNIAQHQVRGTACGCGQPLQLRKK